MLKLFFDDFEDLINDFVSFDKKLFSFQSPIQRVYEPYALDNDTILLTLNLLGIKPEDIKVEVESKGKGLLLKIDAETTNKIINKTYRYSNQFMVNTGRELEKFQWEAKDGILYIVIKYKELEKAKKITAERNSNLLNEWQRKSDKK